MEYFLKRVGRKRLLYHFISMASRRRRKDDWIYYFSINGFERDY